METSCNDRLLERHRFYENNKAAILADVQSIGAKATAKKWKINDASLYHVLKRWEREAKKAEPKSKVTIRTKRVPQGKAHKVNPYKRNRYYESNKTAIIADLITIGRTATRHKWGIPRGATIFSLEKRWLTPEQIALIDAIPSTQNTSTNGRLPSLPEFSDWGASVQVKWLEVYEKLLDRYSSENR